MTGPASVYSFRADLAGPRSGRQGGLTVTSTSMPEPDETSREAFENLDQKLETFEASRKAKPSPLSGLGDSSSDGFRMLGQILGGVLGGLGLGWLVDRLAHTSPFGILVGLLVGVGFSVFAAVRTATAMSAKADASPAPAAPASEDDDD
ncbi:MAG: AtpZ/AtpI family protein [Caulobacteraceae bacterium]